MHEETSRVPDQADDSSLIGNVVGPRSKHRGALAPELLVPLSLALASFALIVARFNWLCDDAFISFRYARHLALGHGLTFNVGDPAPVEGFSNLLWVVVLAPFERFGRWAPVVSRVLSVGCGVILLARLSLAMRRDLALGRLATAGGALFCATLPPFAVWATSGLATMPFALVMFLAFETLFLSKSARRVLPCVIVFAALVLLRSDGFVWGAWLVVLRGVTALFPSVLPGGERFRESGPRRRLPRELVGALAGLVPAVVVLTAWRLATFGDWLPNAARAKSEITAWTLQRGLEYAGTYVLEFPHWPLLAVAALAVAVKKGTLSRALLAALLLHASTWGYAVATGGDFMAMGRWLVAGLPFLALAFGSLLESIRSRPLCVSVAAVGIGLSLVPAYDLHLSPKSWRTALDFRLDEDRAESEYQQWEKMVRHTERWARLGKLLGEKTAPGESMPRAAIGAIGYFSELTIYDCAGLVDREIAALPAPAGKRKPGHDKLVPVEHFLDRSPTYMAALLVKIPAGKEHELEPKSRKLLGQIADETWIEYPPRAIRLEKVEGTRFEKYEWHVLLERRDLREPTGASRSSPTGAPTETQSSLDR